jgi:enamine deaminase RidA (YjgF/YER057c/UK114 family)
MSKQEQITRPIPSKSQRLAHLPLAAGVKAGGWVFVSGLLPDDLGDASRPRSGVPAPLRQATAVWTQAADILRESGSDVSRVVRCDQFFQDWRAVPFFHQARRAACGAYIAPSTSILQPGMLIPGASMMMDVVAVAANGAVVEPIYPEGLDLPATSSFVPVARAGELVFVAGFLAAQGEGDLGGVAPEAQVPEGHLWKGNRIQLEANYVIRKKLVPALAGAGLTLQDVVKANVFLWDVEDVPAFNQVWADAFKGAIPATTIIPTSQPGFAIADSRIEINLVATRRREAAVRVEDGRAARAVCTGHPVAVRAGDFLFFSGLLAADGGGLIAPAKIDESRRHVVSSIEAQMEYLVDLAEEVCERCDASLRNVVRIGQAHTDLNDFLPACRVWERRLPDMLLPISSVCVPAPLIVPGCTVQLDLWIYSPR